MISRAQDITHEELRPLVGVRSRVVLEIGANDGSDTARMLTTFPEARIYCFECDPRPLVRFKQSLWGYLESGRVRLAEIALDESAGIKTFHQSGGRAGSMADWDKSGSLCRPTGHIARSPEIAFKETIEVRTATLDDWIAVCAMELEQATIDLIWLDTQGAERRVFAGASNALQRTRFLKAECHRTELYEGQFSEAEMIAALPGWTCIGRFADDLVFRNDRCVHA